MDDAQLNNRPPQAMAILTASLVMGLLGNFFFYSYYPLGLNLPLYVFIFWVLAGALIWLFQKTVSLQNAIFLLPVFFFSITLAVFDSPLLITFNLSILAVALFLTIRFLLEPRFLGGSWIMPLMFGFYFSIIGWLEASVWVLFGSAEWLQNRKNTLKNAETVSAVIRGLVITIPIVIVLGVLLGSADVVFGDLLEGALEWVKIDNLDALIAHLIVIGFFAFLSLITLKTMLVGQILQITPREPQGKPFRLGMIETGMALGSVDLLFLAFVVIQGAYFFGGESNITVEGYTYAEYARRGFFELLAASIITMAIIVVLDWLTERKSPAQEMLFRGLAIGLILMTLVMLVSAFQRLSLYEDAFGFTRLRVISHVFTVWLGGLFVILIADILRLYPRLFWLGLGVIAVGYLATLNGLNVDAFIARQNIERYHETGKLDTTYLYSLSHDTVPALVDLLEESQREEDFFYEGLLEELGYRLYDLDQEREKEEFLGYNVARARAWHTLDDRREMLEPFIKQRPFRYF